MLHEKRPKPRLLMFSGWQMLLLDVHFCDVDHPTIGLTNLAIYSVQQFLYSFILFWTLD